MVNAKITVPASSGGIILGDKCSIRTIVEGEYTFAPSIISLLLPLTFRSYTLTIFLSHYTSISHFLFPCSYLLYLLLFHYAFAYANTPLPSLHIYQSTCSDLLPGGVDRALQHGGHGVHHPLLSLSDDSSPSTRRPSGTYEYLLTVHGALSLLFLSRKLNFDSILDDF